MYQVRPNSVGPKRVPRCGSQDWVPRIWMQVSSLDLPKMVPKAAPLDQPPTTLLFGLGKPQDAPRLALSFLYFGGGPNIAPRIIFILLYFFLGGGSQNGAACFSVFGFNSQKGAISAATSGEVGGLEKGLVVRVGQDLKSPEAGLGGAGFGGVWGG